MFPRPREDDAKSWVSKTHLTTGGGRRGETMCFLWRNATGCRSCAGRCSCLELQDLFDEKLADVRWVGGDRTLCHKAMQLEFASLFKDFFAMTKNDVLVDLGAGMGRSSSPSASWLAAGA